MSERDKCKLILDLMRNFGYTDVCGPEGVDSWTDDEVEYFLDNYQEHYLKEKRV